MDAIVSTALEEICAEGASGITLPKLWRGLRGCLASSGLPMDGSVKEAIWKRLLSLTGLQFSTQGAVLDAGDPSIESPEQSEKSGLRVAAAENVRDSFLGIYDVKAANVEVTPVQKQVLERIAVARADGIAQSQLSKEFKMKENKLFYFLKKLESQGLIARQSTILRTKEASVVVDDEVKDGSVVSTNLICLYRYAKRLGSLQRFEIATSGISGIAGDTDEGHLARDDTCVEASKEDVHVKDYVPEMKAICDMLEEASGKVLVVSDIKVARGYRMRTGHRTWRNICNKMKDAHVIEEFPAKVNGKVVKCLRLLKSFNPRDFEPKTVVYGYEGFHSEPALNCGRRGQITDQIVELPIELRIYDIIDAEGPKGITICEVSRRLGLNTKRTETRIYDMCWRMPKRFPMHMQFETYNRTKIYRVWTHENFERYSSSAAFSNCENNLDSADVSGQCEMDLVPYEQSSKKNQQSGLVLQESHTEKVDSGQVGCALSSPNVSLFRTEEVKGVHSVADPQDQLPVISTTMHDAPSERPLSVSSASKIHSSQNQKSPSAATVDSAQRERRILSRLKNEKFLLTVELHKWLEGLDNDKQTTMARKTLTRSLQRLQQEGHCKCIQVSVPALTNCKSSRATEVILHPAIEGLSSELLGQIHRRLRDFDMQSRGQGLNRPKIEAQHVTELEDVKRHINCGVSDTQSVKVEAMRMNGYVPARMVRAKLLHSFLWTYLRGLPDWEGALSTDEHDSQIKNPHSRLKFLLSSAIECMPLELFLQVVGSEKKIENLVERCKLGLRLSDLPVQEYKSLMDTLPTGRLSRVIDILFRLKLIQLATGAVVDTTILPHCASVHSLEPKPYIEVPRSFFTCSSCVRHDFVLSNREAVDSYWQTLEYCYVAADRESASHSFPGSAVPEVFLARSWTSIRVMRAEQHMELLRRLKNYEPNRKIPFGECVKISKELDLTLEQVLHVSYEMRRPRHRRLLRRAKHIQKEHNLEMHKVPSVLQKRKRHSKAALLNQVHAERRTKEMSISRTSDEENIEELATAGKQDVNLSESQNDENMIDALDFRTSKEGEIFASLKQSSLSRQKLKHPRKFPWTDILDRKLIIKYVKYRAPLGAKFSRVDWASIPELPADPDTCKRRMHRLNRNMTVRKAVLKLCNIVGGSYAKFLSKKIEDRIMRNDCSGMADLNSNGQENWDDFEVPEVKMALDNVLHCKSLVDLESAKRFRSRYEKNVVDGFPTNSDIHEYVRLENDKQTLSSTVGSGSYKKFLGPSDGKCLDACKQVEESLSVANAVELFKLVFLSTSTAPEVRSLLAESLNWYSEQDLTVAFNYLKDNKLMEHGPGSQQLFLSQRFLHNAYSSPFPVDSGKRADKFSTWLLKEEKGLMEDGISLDLDLQCGEVFYLFALLSSGRLSIAPCMPTEGTGEADEPKNLTCEGSEGKLKNDDTTANQKMWWRKDCEPCNRREKGFPGIKLCLKRRIIPMVEAVAFLPEKDGHSSPLPHVSAKQEESLGTPFKSSSSLFSEIGSTSNLSSMSLNDSLWDSMVSYAKSLSSVSRREQGLITPDQIKNVYNAIHQAGDQGLSIKEITENIIVHGNGLTEICLDALTEFQVIMKVNAYNHVRVVDSSYKPKYFITTLADHKQDSVEESSQQMNCDISRRILGDPENAHASENCERPAESCLRDGFGKEGTRDEECVEKVASTKNGTGEPIKFPAPGDTYRCRPILPWINGDGTTNGTLYRGLVRRILGTVMQNPGILEEDLISQMDVLNPQSCRQLLELMVLDNHIIEKKMHQTTGCGPPSILGGLFGPNVNLTKSVFRKHYFANPMSTSLL